MTTFIHNWRAMFITGLISFLALAGMPAWAYTVVANASASTNLSGIAPWTANLDGSASTCNSSPQDYPCQWHWNFGDGTSSDPTSDAAGNTSVSHIYNTAGTYTVTLTVTLQVPTGTKPQSSTTLTVTVQQGETLNSYVTTCKQQLGFTDADVAAIAGNLNCNKGILFATDTNVVNDYFGYARVNDSVDLAFACRWANNNGSTKTPPFASAVSIELLMNNHQNGNTCFFQASNTNPDGSLKIISTAIVSPTVAAAAAPNTPQATFWNVPIQLDRSLPCVDCHVEGPYIATPRISPFLAQYGLLNNGHVTFGPTLDANGNPVGGFHAVGSTFAHFNNLAASENATGTCANGCHSIGYNSTQGNVTGFLGGSIDTLLPGITSVIDINGSETPDISVSTSGVMPPYDDDSNYHWVNLDTPNNSTPSAGVESERFADAMNHVANSIIPVLFHGYDPNNPNVPSNPNCSQPGNNVPTLLEAHVVGSNDEFVVAQPGRFAFLPDRLSKFNLKDGLTCLNSDQDPGQTCSNYSIQYECTNTTTNVKNWVNWPAHALSSDGDHEERNGANPCPSGSTATAIQASFTASNNWTYSAIGPNDRLASFSQYGLTCNNSDQPDGQCSNYVVRYSGCIAPPPTQSSKTLTNQNVPSSGAKQLTAASSSLTKAQGHNNTWNTQQWSIEPVTNTEYVRLHNPGTNVYLTVTSTAEQATVGTAASNTTTNEMWLVEPVANSSYVRLKNLFSGRYLTMGDPNSYTSTPDYIPIFSQARNTDWNTQLWLIQ